MPSVRTVCIVAELFGLCFSSEISPEQHLEIDRLAKENHLHVIPSCLIINENVME